MFQTIQGCRFVAAMLVVLLHLGKAVALEKYFGFSAFARPFSFGDAGVAFFFVLSGFLITWIHGKDIGNPDRVASYARKRFSRIYPTYWIVLSIAWVVVAASGIDTPRDLITILKTVALLPQDRSVIGGTGAPILIVAWSLQYEILFYAAFAVFIISRPLGCIVLLFFGVNFIYCQTTSCSFPSSFVANVWVVLFLLGVLTAALCQSTVNIAKPAVLAMIGSSLFFLFGFFESSEELQLPFLDRRLVYGFLSCVIIFGLIRTEQSNPRKGNYFILLLGDASYALYLIHFPLISLLCKAATIILPRTTIGASIAFVSILVLCVAGSALFYVWVERPILRILSRLGSASVPNPKLI